MNIQTFYVFHCTTQGKKFDKYLIIIIVHALANVILKKVWAKLVILRQKLHKEERKQVLKNKEKHRDKRMVDMALQVQQQVLKILKVVEAIKEKGTSKRGYSHR